MNQPVSQNRRWVLASRPQGAPVAENFRLETQPVPAPAEGRLLLRTVWLSLDPYMRGRMSDAPSYSPPVEIGAVMVGGTVSRVEQSNHPDFKPGEWVLGYSGWQEYELSDGSGLVKLGENPSHPSWSLGILGMPGFTAYMGLLDIGQPKAGETLVVAAATGPVGATVGQIGKIKGCRVVGVAGGAEKCRHAVEVLGFDLCLDHHAADFAEVTPFEQANQRLGRVLQSVRYLFAIVNFALLHPAPHRFLELLNAVTVILADDKALHTNAFLQDGRHQERQAIRPLGQARRIVAAHQAAHRHARGGIQ